MNALDTFLDRLEAGCRKADLVREGHLVAGVSGGMDSVSLLRGLELLGYSATVAHVNYGLRGEESDADEGFVRQLAFELGLPVQVKAAELQAGNVQAEARRIRYAFFEEVADRVGAEAVAVGHTRDDHLEGVLLGLLREASPRAVAGMPVRRQLGASALFRPMLGISRAAVRAAAEEGGWTWRDDSSNASDAYLRNRLRHEEAAVFHSNGWLDLADRIQEAFDATGPPRDLKRLAAKAIGGRALPVDAVAALPEGRRHGLFIEAVRAWLPGAPLRDSVGTELDDLLKAQPGRLKSWGRARVVRDRERLTFLPDPMDWPPASLCEVSEVSTPVGVVRVEPDEFAESGERGEPICLPVARAGVTTLVVRPWRPGDRIALEHGSALVSDVLTDARVPPSVKPVWPVVEGPSEIVWVPGIRRAAGSRTDETSDRASLSWHPKTV